MMHVVVFAVAVFGTSSLNVEAMTRGKRFATLVGIYRDQTNFVLSGSNASQDALKGK